MKSESDVFNLIEGVYQASLQDNPWHGVLRKLSTHMDAVGGVLLEIDSKDFKLVKAISENLNDSQDDCAIRMHGKCPTVAHSLARPYKHTNFDYNIVTEDYMRGSEFYDWLENVCGTKYFVGSRLNGDTPVTVLASVVYTAKQGHASREQIDHFRILSPHLANAWQIGRLRDRADAASSFTSMITSPLPWGLVGLDEQGRCIALNEQAKHILAQNDGLSLDNGKLIRAAHAAVNRTLQKVIGGVLSSNKAEILYPGDAISISRPSRRTDYVLQIMPGMNRRSDFGPSMPSALIVITDPSQPAPLDLQQLRLLFGLTEREGDLTGWLLCGMRLPDAAREMGISHRTARVHLQNVFHKTGCSSQPGLINRLRSLFPMQIGP